MFFSHEIFNITNRFYKVLHMKKATSMPVMVVSDSGGDTTRVEVTELNVEIMSEQKPKYLTFWRCIIIIKKFWSNSVMSFNAHDLH